MKRNVAVTIVWLAAGSFCFGQEPVQLELRTSGNTLSATAKLSAKNWSSREGSTAVESSDPSLKIKSPAHYTIKGDAKQKTLSAVIEYTYPSAGALASELTLTGVKDANGATATVFKGHVPPFAALVGADASIAGSKEQPPLEQTPSADNPSDPAAESKPVQTNVNAHTGQQPARSALLSANWHDWLLYGDTALGLLLLFGGVLLWRGRTQPNTAMVLPVMAAQPEVDHGTAVKQAKSDALLALKQAAEAKREVMAARGEGEEIGKQLKEIQKQVAALNDLRLAAIVAERNEILSSLAQALDELPQERSAPVRSGLAAAQQEEAAAPAIVNRWLSQGGGDRSQLLALAGELELPAELMNHQDLNRVFDDLTTFEYPFVLDADGPWLWVSIAGTQDFWAAPADAAFFGMGRAPSLLERLFEGMQKANQGFQFRTIYKPCRLRPVAGKDGLYTVVSKGLLRLEGASAPAAPDPKDFAFLASEKTSSQVAGTMGSNPGKQLASWVTSTSHQLREQQKRLELATAAQKATADFLSRREFKQQFDSVQRQLAAFDAKLRARTVAPAAPLDHASEPLALQPKPDVAVATLPVAQSGVKRDGWQEALRRAAEAPGSEPETTGVPSDEVYVQRARNLAAELRKLDPASGAAVVHLKRDQVHETFEVHETEASAGNPLEVVCTTCNAAHTWQLAVCMGARETEIEVLYPLGGMSKGKYLSGYTGLIADLPVASFTIGGMEEPARLRPTDATAGTYRVSRKMRLTQTTSGEAGR